MKYDQKHVDKRIKQKYTHHIKQIARYFGLKTNLLQGLKKKWK